MNASTLLVACALDVMVGDPRWLPHPVRLMGWAIAGYERSVRPILSNRTCECLAGIVLAVGLPAVSYGGAWLVVDQASRLHEVIGQGSEVALAFTTIAARDLADHARAVRHALGTCSLEAARAAVSWMVGRDTAQLSEEAIVRATVESVAESTADGVVAPLLYLVLGGPPLALAYKAINTLDSMVGHLDDRYRHFGWASARMDDLVNWVPARLTALLIVLAAGVVGCDTSAVRRAWRIFRRDGKQHQSPNSGRPEAAIAGALGVQLGGTNYYEGVATERPALGEMSRPLTAHSIRDALRIMWTVFFMGALVASGLLTL